MLKPSHPSNKDWRFSPQTDCGFAPLKVSGSISSAKKKLLKNAVGAIIQ